MIAMSEYFLYCLMKFMVYFSVVYKYLLKNKQDVT